MFALVVSNQIPTPSNLTIFCILKISTVRLRKLYSKLGRVGRVILDKEELLSISVSLAFQEGKSIR